MEVKVSLTCEVQYHLIGFGDEFDKWYSPKEFERVHDSLKRV